MEIPKRMNDILDGGFVKTFLWEREGCNNISDDSILKERCKESIKIPLSSTYSKLYQFFEKYIESISKLKNSTKSRVPKDLMAFNEAKLKLLNQAGTDINQVKFKAMRLQTNNMININLENYDKLLKKIHEGLGSGSSDLAISIQTGKLLETAGDSGHRLFKELKENEVKLEDYLNH